MGKRLCLHASINYLSSEPCAWHSFHLYLFSYGVQQAPGIIHHPLIQPPLQVSILPSRARPAHWQANIQSTINGIKLANSPPRCSVAIYPIPPIHPCFHPFSPPATPTMIYFLFLDRFDQSKSLAQMDQKVLCRKKVVFAVEIHANKLLSPVSLGRGEKVEKKKARKFSLTKRQTTTQMWKVQEGC